MKRVCPNCKKRIDELVEVVTDDVTASLSRWDHLSVYGDEPIYGQMMRTVYEYACPSCHVTIFKNQADARYFLENTVTHRYINANYLEEITDDMPTL